MFENLLTIFTLVGLEDLLSADNALILAILVKHLGKPQQKKALLYGIAGAFLFRPLSLLIVRQIMNWWYLKAIGACYLAYLAIDHFVRKRGFHHTAEPSKKPGFWRTVTAVELTDIAFAIDGVLVAVASPTGSGSFKRELFWAFWPSGWRPGFSSRFWKNIPGWRMSPTWWPGGPPSSSF